MTQRLFLRYLRLLIHRKCIPPGGGEGGGVKGGMLQRKAQQDHETAAVRVRARARTKRAHEPCSSRAHTIRIGVDTALLKRTK